MRGRAAVLTLPIKKKWYDMILSGEKKEEYRDITPYYQKRFQTIGLLNEDGGATLHSAIVVFRNGYAKTSPQFRAKVTLRKKGGRREWGAVHGKKYYVLLVLEIIDDQTQ